MGTENIPLGNRPKGCSSAKVRSRGEGSSVRGADGFLLGCFLLGFIATGSEWVPVLFVWGLFSEGQVWPAGPQWFTPPRRRPPWKG